MEKSKKQNFPKCMNEREEIDTVATRSQLRTYLTECKQTNTNIRFRKDSNPKDEKIIEKHN